MRLKKCWNMLAFHATSLALQVGFLRSSPRTLAISSLCTMAMRVDEHVTEKCELRPKIVCLAGPTGTGKSNVAMQLCDSFGGEVISADSVQVYRGLDIGSNKPSSDELERVKHHLVDIVDPVSEFTVGEWLRQAHAAIKDVTSRGKVPVIVGGTMLYMQWLVYGQPDAPQGDAATQDAVQVQISPYEIAGDWEGGLNVLKQINPTRALQINKNDWFRLKRSIQISLDSNEVSEVFTGIRHGAADEQYDVRSYFIVANRTEAARSISDRCETMLKAGLLKEVADLLVSGRLHKESSPGRAIGYRQTLDYLLRLNPQPDDSVAFMQFYYDFCSATRRYASAQMKWFHSSKGKDFIWVRRNFEDLDDVKNIANAIANDLCSSEECHIEKLMDSNQSELRKLNRDEAKQMRLFIPPDLRKKIGNDIFSKLIQDADECTSLVNPAIFQNLGCKADDLDRQR